MDVDDVNVYPELGEAAAEGAKIADNEWNACGT